MIPYRQLAGEIICSLFYYFHALDFILDFYVLDSTLCSL